MTEPTNPLSNRFLAYVRVSSKDQSRGTSLDQQKSFIQSYAQHKEFTVTKFYGEVESASKVGREIFDEMIKKLRKDKLRGIIFHKVDRSARNPRDQALLYELMEEGYELHFVAESLSTAEPMGRNMMYMLWGMASGYSENLKMEINKGITGRLKQGKWPLPAPLGYKNEKDCTKVVDPIRGPLVKKLFEEYATGKYSVQNLTALSRKLGITNTNGNGLDKNALHLVLRNTFYYGLITHKRGTFQGEHEPLISKSLFDKVQFILKQRGFLKVNSFDYSFRGLLTCRACGRRLKASTSKGKYKYYHCRDWNCGNGVLAESDLESQFLDALKHLEFTNEEADMFRKAVMVFRKTVEKSRGDVAGALGLEIENIKARLDALLQKYIDEKIDEETYSKTREALLNKQIELREQRESLEKTDDKAFNELEELVKLLRNPAIAYEKADPVNKRRLVISMVANFSLRDKTLVITWKNHFEMVANRPKLLNGGGYWKKFALFTKKTPT